MIDREERKKLWIWLYPIWVWAEDESEANMIVDEELALTRPSDGKLFGPYPNPINSEQEG